MGNGNNGGISFGGGAFGASPLKDIANQDPIAGSIGVEQQRASAIANTQKNLSDAEALRQQQAQAQQLAQQKLQASNDYKSQQGALAQSAADEDAFTQARNAARRAKGTTLFGGWG